MFLRYTRNSLTYANTFNIIHVLAVYITHALHGVNFNRALFPQILEKELPFRYFDRGNTRRETGKRRYRIESENNFQRKQENIYHSPSTYTEEIYEFSTGQIIIRLTSTNTYTKLGFVVKRYLI